LPRSSFVPQGTLGFLGEGRFTWFRGVQGRMTSQGISPSFSRGWLCENVFEIGDTQRPRSYYVSHWGVHHSLGSQAFVVQRKDYCSTWEGECFKGSVNSCQGSCYVL